MHSGLLLSRHFVVGNRVRRHLRSALPRFYAASDKEDRSWGDIARDAASLAGAAVKKLGDTASSLVTGRREAQLERRREKEETAALGRVFGGGLLGNALGTLFGAGLKLVAGQVRASMQASEALHSAASAAVARDRRVSDALGSPVRCSAPTSVASSSQSINGVGTSVTRVTFSVQGPCGVARVLAVGTDGDRRDITVVLPGGNEFRVDDGDFGGGDSKVIDLPDSDYRIR